MQEIKVSLFASAIRPHLWGDLFKSLESTSVPYEVVFAGTSIVEFVDCRNKLAYGEITPEGKRKAHYINPFPENFKYIKTKNIKPAQCYQVALNACKGELVSWIADDCEFSEDCYGKAYEYWKSLGHEKACLSIQTIEDGYKYNMNDHSFVGFDRTTALMAPVNLMSRKVLTEDVNGLDRRFVCGQYENDCIMQLYEIGGSVIIFKEDECIIDHGKHGKDHSFRAGFTKDREVLESIWGKRGELLYTGKSLAREPFSKKNIMEISQSNNISSIWR